MPNHCTNVLVVTCEKDKPQQLDEFQERAKGIDPYDEGKEVIRDNGSKKLTFDEVALNFDSFVPLPRENGKVISFDKGGYEWCIKNWGTKWGAYNIGVKRDLYELVYTFSSAWAPPTNAIKAIGKMYPSLTFELEYEEPGCEFEGSLIVEDGEVKLDDIRDYIPMCNQCEEKKVGGEYDEDGDYYCEECKEELDG